MIEGSKVFYTGKDVNLGAGLKVARGQQGEVTGKQTDDKRVPVHFPGCDGSIMCCLSSVHDSAVSTHHIPFTEAQTSKREYS